MVKRLIILVVAMGLFVGAFACKKQVSDVEPISEHGAMQGMMQKAGEEQPTAVAPLPEGVVEAGNKTCPISGEAVSGKDFVVYQGKRYGLCCKACEEMFLKDPDKYIQKLRERGDIK